MGKVKKDETQRERFVRLAEYRMNRLLKNLDQLGMLSSKASYEFTQDDVDQIVNVLFTGVEKVQTRFSKGAPEVSAFTLD